MLKPMRRVAGLMLVMPHPFDHIETECLLIAQYKYINKMHSKREPTYIALSQMTNSQSRGNYRFAGVFANHNNIDLYIHTIMHACIDARTAMCIRAYNKGNLVLLVSIRYVLTTMHHVHSAIFSECHTISKISFKPNRFSIYPTEKTQYDSVSLIPP